MTAYALCGRLVAQSGQGEQLAQLLLEAAEALEHEKSCQLYVVNRATDDPDGVWVMELWDSPEAHAASLEIDAVQTLIARARPLIADMGPRIELEPVGGKGFTVHMT